MNIYFSENIKRLRKERNLTQEGLADFIGVSFQAVSMITAFQLQRCGTAYIGYAEVQVQLSFAAQMHLVRHTVAHRTGGLDGRVIASGTFLAVAPASSAS